MSAGNERVRNPISITELERRWAAAREVMVAHDVDALIIQGSNNLTGGGSYLRWICGLSALSSQPQAVIFPKNGLMTLIAHGPLGDEAQLEGTHPEYRGIGQRVSTPSFPSVAYTGKYDAELLAGQIKEYGFRRVALIGANNMYYGPTALMKDALTSVTFLDLTDQLDQIIAIKSPEEISFIRRTAQMQDEVLRKVRAYVQPGMRDFEVMAYAQYEGQLLGSETGYYLGCSSEPGQPLGHRMTPQQGRQIREGDIFLFQEETSGPGGFFVHIARLFAFGKVPNAIADKYAAMIEAQEYTTTLLKPGADSREIFASYNSYMRSRGLPEEARLHCHGQGYPSVERPLIRFDESMRIAANMNLGIHPSYAAKDMFVTVCDNFLTHEDGTVERLHKAPQEIIEL